MPGGAPVEAGEGDRELEPVCLCRSACTAAAGSRSSDRQVPGLGQPGRQRSSHRLTHVIICHGTAFSDSISFNDLWARVQPGEPKPLQY